MSFLLRNRIHAFENKPTNTKNREDMPLKMVSGFERYCYSLWVCGCMTCILNNAAFRQISKCLEQWATDVPPRFELRMLQFLPQAGTILLAFGSESFEWFTGPSSDRGKRATPKNTVRKSCVARGDKQRGRKNAAAPDVTLN